MDETRELMELNRAFKQMTTNIPQLEEVNKLIEDYLKKFQKARASPEAMNFLYEVLLLDDDVDDFWMELLDIEKRNLLIPNIHPNMAQKVVNDPSYDVQYSQNTANELK